MTRAKPAPPKKEAPRDRLLGLSAERRAELLDPAAREFLAHGFEAASLNRILADAGMSKGQAYYYVTGKADLYRAVIERGFERLTAQMDFHFVAPTSSRAFWAQVEGVFSRLTMVLVADAPLATLARGIYDSAGSLEAVGDLVSRFRASLDQWIVAGQAVGAVRDDLPQTLLVEMIFGAAREADRWFATHWTALTPDEALRLNAEVLGMFKAMVKRPAKK